MAQAVVEEIVDPYEGRYLGRTKAQKVREAEIRDSERAHIAAELIRLGDGRQNRKTPPEKRSAFREIAAKIVQHRGI